MNGSIYLIKNDVNDKVYIGQTIQQVETRFKQHLRLNKSNKRQAIFKAIESIGKEHFSYVVLESNIETYSELNKLEEYYISKYDSIIPNGYNLCPGGQRWRRKRLLNEKDKIQVIALYSEGESSRKIAEQFNVSNATILDILHSAEVVMRKKNCNLPNRTSKIKKCELEKMFCEEKMLIKDIASELGVNTKTIYRALKRYNLKEYNAGQKLNT